MNSPTYLIVGCGYFGSRAAEKLLRKDPKPKIIVVDRNKEAVKKVSNLPAETFTGDGPVYLGEFFSEGRSTDYIIPAIPFHLAFEFILSQLKTWGAKKKRIPPLPGLPNPIVGKTGDLYTSLSDFLCSEDCPEPTRYCTATGKRRAKPLYQILKDLGGPFESKVVRSRPLELGVGGFRPEVLIDLLEDMKEKIEPGRSILISTASRCHGVTSALSF
jgi:hypothetical protein